MHLDAIQVVGVVNAMVYYYHVDHRWSIEWATDGACIIWCNISCTVVFGYFLLKLRQVDKEKCICK